MRRVEEQRQVCQVAAGRRADEERRRVGLSVRELWLSYESLGGEVGEFDLDGFLAGVLPLEKDEQYVLYRSLRQRRRELRR